MRRAVVIGASLTALGYRFYKLGKTINLGAWVMNRQSEVIARQMLDMHAMKLHYTREMMDLMVAWRLHMEQPEVDVRDQVADIVRALHDELAVLEEHSPV